MSDLDEVPPQLRQMRRFALLLLLVAAALFVAADVWLGRGGPEWLGFVRAAAEAGVVGGLADWFAVTALFRHPLGLPIPHTALIPRKKRELGESLSEFVAEYFLTEKAVSQRVSGARVPQRLGAWLSTESGSARVDRECAPLFAQGISVMRQDTVRGVLAEIVHDRVKDAHVAPVAGRLLEEVLRDGSHRHALSAVFLRGVEWVEGHRAFVVEAVRSRAPDWTPDFVDELVADRLHKEMCKFAREVASRPDHELRVEIDAALTRLSVRLRDDAALRARVEEAKMNLLDRPEVQEAAAELVSAGRRIALEMLGHEESILRVQFRKMLQDVGARLSQDGPLARAADGYLSAALTTIATKHGDEITALITDTINQWDGDQAAKRIERHVGRDLQFIRINGTLVGALVGLLLYSASHLW